jgi:hypothetical protein
MPAAQLYVNGAIVKNYAEVICKQGADFNIALQMKNADGTSYNLVAANATVQGVLRTNYYTANSNTMTTVYIGNDAGANGNVNVGMIAANTANLQPLNYVYEVNYTGNDGHFRILEGLLVVTPSVLSGGKYNF